MSQQLPVREALAARKSMSAFDTPHGQLLAGPAKLITTFDHFTAALPDIARGAQHEPNEIGGFKNYPTFVWCVAEFLKRA